MRKIPAALAILGLATVGLAGCSLPGSSDCTPPASDAELLDVAAVSGPVEEAPEVELYTPYHATEGSSATVEQGDEGTAITRDDQQVVIDFTLLSGETGETLVATPYSGDLTNVLGMEQITQTFPTWSDALQCASAGSRVVVSMAPGDIEAEAAASIGLAEDESAVAVVDVRKVYLGAADGANQFNSGTGLPTVVRTPDGQPGLIIPSGTAPTDVVVQTLKKGDGEVVTGDVPVRVHVLGVSWDDQEIVKNTWDAQPEPIAIAGDPVLSEALVGQTVGSQVMVVVPAEAGGTEQATVFVFDILGLDPASPQQ
ncbi:FKBP-type peptidyl-prolyl cis-trans isomerase [Microbacterium sp. HJ5]